MNSSNLWNTITPKLVGELLRKNRHFLKWRNSNGKVLDVGCGEGTVTRKILYPFVKDRIEKLIATDISENLINYAKKYNEIPKIDFQVTDTNNGTQVEEMKEKFDQIFSFYAAQWIPDHRTFVSGLRKLLKPDGQIFVTHFSGSSINDSFNKHFEEGTWSKYLPQKRIMLYYTDDPVGYIRKIVMEVGFNVEICENKKTKIVIPNYRGFVRDVVSLNPHLKGLTTELRETYIQDHLKYCTRDSTYLKEPDTFECPYEVLTCIATKI